MSKIPMTDQRLGNLHALLEGGGLSELECREIAEEMERLRNQVKTMLAQRETDKAIIEKTRELERARIELTETVLSKDDANRNTLRLRIGRLERELREVLGLNETRKY